jgi:hypothetical protein
MMMVQAPRAAQKFTIEQSAFELWRLSDMEYRVLRECSFPIRQMGTAVLGLQLADRRAGRRLMLPKLLVLLEEDYGAASACIDNWKQTFSFPFLSEHTRR